MFLAGHGQVLAQIFAERLLNSLLEGIVLSLFGWALLRALRGQNSSTRFAIWFSTMLAIAALPFFGNMSFGSASAFASRSAFQLPGSWAVRIFMVWAVLAGAGLAKIGFGFWRLRRLRQTCTVIDSASLHPALHKTLNDFGSSRRVTICTSGRLRVPAAIGFIKPAIVLPPWALELSPAELNAVVLHELAHLHRRDDWTNLAQEILKALFFFHPALWWIGRGLSLEREMACDDFVLAVTSNPRAYAQCLVKVAEKSFLRRGLALAQAIAGRMQQISRRVTRILDTDRPTASKVCKPALALVVAFSAVCLISLPHAPRLVAFDAKGDSFWSLDLPAIRASAVDSPGVGAKMIPAAFYGPALKSVSQKSPAPSVLGHAAKLQSGKTNHRAAAPIDRANRNFLARQNNPPRLIDANASAANSVDFDYPQSVLLVIRTEQIDSDGRVWSFSMVQLTVFHPVNHQVQKGIIPKST